MRGGIWVLTIFAAIWFAVGVAGAGLPWMALLVPAVLSGALIGWGLRTTGGEPPHNPNVGRLVGIWSAVEVWRSSLPPMSASTSALGMQSCR